MKKIIVGAMAVAMLASLFVVSETIQGQDAKTSAGPHQVGLIDMAEVFQDYEKFKALREALQAEVERSSAEAQAKLEQMKQLQGQAAQLKQDSPDFQAIEKQLLTMKADLESFRQVQQRDFLRKESEIYKQVYMEVQDAVNKYAEYKNLTLIMRFNRSKVEEAENPQEVIQSMNRQVVYHRTSDDITDAVLGYLNREYTKQASAAR